MIVRMDDPASERTSMFLKCILKTILVVDRHGISFSQLVISF